MRWEGKQKNIYKCFLSFANKCENYSYFNDYERCKN